MAKHMKYIPMSKLRKDRTGMNRMTTKFDTSAGDYIMNNNNDILMGANDYRDMFLATFIKTRLEIQKSTITEKVIVRGNSKKALEFIKNNYLGYRTFSSGTDNMLIDMSDALIEIDSSHNTINFRFHSTFEINAKLKEKVLSSFEEIRVSIRWIYDGDGNYINIPLDSALSPIDEMYPFLNGDTLDSYYQRYLDSSASIIILIGPPGTGKTSFIRGFLASTQSSAIVTYDAKILNGDSLFSDFIDSDISTLVIEDADLFLGSRTSGNDMMSRFLNIGDGLVTVKGKKIIFSTNLPTINDIDPALLRPGRCFDVVKFDELKYEHAYALVDKLGIDVTLDENKSYTIGEIFSGTRNSDVKKHKNGFGFC